MTRYDVVVVGAGMSGLSLVLALASPPAAVRSAALVDPAPLAGSARAWASWTASRRLVDPAASSTWSQVRVHARGRERLLDLAPYRYSVVRGPDLEALVRDVLERRRRVDVVPGRVLAVEEAAGGPRVVTDAGDLQARWVLDSRPRAPAAVQGHLSFTGWRVRTAAPGWSPDVPVLMDFRTAAGPGSSFFYVLPEGPGQALVERTRFSSRGPAAAPSADVLDAYLREALGVGSYEAVPAEAGHLLLGAPRSRVLGPHHLAVGAAAGVVKASTGYGFDRAQRDSAALAASLRRHGHPWDIPRAHRRHRYLDAVLLQVLRREPHQLERAFDALLAPGRAVRALRFLDEDTCLLEELRIVAALPPAPFVRAAASLLR